MRVLKILFILVLCVFPLGELGRMQIGDGIAVKINDIFLLLVVVYWILYQREKILQFFVKSTISRAFWIFIVICIVSLLVNSIRFTQQQLLVGSFYLIRFVCYAMLLFITMQFDSDFKKKIKYTLFIAGGILVGIGYLQYAYYQNLRNLYYLGWDEHLYRLFSSFLDPNFAGAFFVLLLLLVLGEFFSLVKQSSVVKKIIYTLFAFFTFGALLLTYSRSALIMFLVGITLFFILAQKKRFIFVSIGVLILFFIIASRNFSIENLNLLRTASSEARVDTAQNALTIISKNPLIGVGFNMYKYAQVQYGFRSVKGIQTSHADGSTDNSFLFVLATTGIVGFTAFMWFWFTIIKKLFYLYKNKQNINDHYLVIAVLASIGGIFVDALFINSLFYPFIMEWLFIVIGLSYANNKG